MYQKLRPFLLLIIIYSLVSFTGKAETSLTAVHPFRLLFSGYAQLTGPLQLELTVAPPVVRPGATLAINLTLTNNGSETAVPEVLVAIPDGLSLDRFALPSGTNMNLQTNSLSWQPIVEGNGGVRQLSIPLHADVADLSQPERTINAILRHNNQEQSLSAAYWIGLPPQATITLNPARASVGQPIQLVAGLSGPGPHAQVWRLGDGRSVDADNPVVIYPLAGTYQVTLQVANPLAAVTVGKSIVIVPEPAAYFKPDDATAAVNQPITFINQSGGQSPLRYQWEFGDGATSSEVQPTHPYSAPGVYLVRLIVENDFGQAETFWPVTVGLPPIADALISATGTAGEPVYGEAFGDDSVISYTWDMGDGRVVEGQQISHIYRSGGDYWVTMSASNEFDHTQISHWVHIQPGLTHLYLPLVMLEHSDTASQGDSLAGDLWLDDGIEVNEPIVLQPLNLSRTTSPAEQLYWYINAAREMFDISPLSHVYELSVAAQRHTEDMSTAQFTGHTGSDGSTPPMRLLRYGYPYGYGGEATAWGMSKALDAVEFWLNSPGHRRIILNQGATDVGVGYTVNYNAPNVWYWTAEFGSPALPVVDIDWPTPEPQPVAAIQLLNPVQNSSSTWGSNPLVFAWEWPGTLADGQQFVIYMGLGDKLLPVGVVTQPLVESQYQFRVAVDEITAVPGIYQWLVRLESGTAGDSLTESEPWTLQILTPPTPVATPTTAPLPPTPTPTLLPSATPLPTQTPLPISTPLPTAVP